MSGAGFDVAQPLELSIRNASPSPSSNRRIAGLEFAHLTFDSPFRLERFIALLFQIDGRLVQLRGAFLLLLRLLVGVVQEHLHVGYLLLRKCLPLNRVEEPVGYEVDRARDDDQDADSPEDFGRGHVSA